MCDLNIDQRSAIAGKHDTWLAGMYAGRLSVQLDMDLKEAEAANPYRIDGKDPLEGWRR